MVYTYFDRNYDKVNNLIRKDGQSSSHKIHSRDQTSSRLPVKEHCVLYRMQEMSCTVHRWIRQNLAGQIRRTQGLCEQPSRSQGNRPTFQFTGAQNFRHGSYHFEKIVSKDPQLQKNKRQTGDGQIQHDNTRDWIERPRLLVTIPSLRKYYLLAFK